MPKTAWFIKIHKQTLGPFLAETIVSLLKAGRLYGSDLAWNETMPKKGNGLPIWVVLAEISEFAGIGPVNPEEAPPGSPPVVGKFSEPDFQPPPPSPAQPVLSPISVELRPKGSAAPASTSTTRVERPAQPRHDTAEADRKVRRHMRAPLQGRLTTSDRKSYEVVNVSESGLLLKCQDLPPVGTTFDVRLEAAALGEPMVLSTRVTRHADTQVFRGFGVEFVTIMAEDLDRIQKFIRAQVFT